MKYRNIIKRSLFVAMVAFAATACEEEVNIGNAQAPDIADDSDAIIYVSDANGSTGHSNLEFRGSTGLDLYVNATVAHAADESVNFAYDLTVLDEYNNRNNTKFEAIPESWVSFSNGGVGTLTAGEIQSSPVTMTITSDGSLDNETTYVVPLRISSAGTATVAASSQSRLVFVKDHTSLPDCFKTWTDDKGEVHEGIKIFSCMEK